MQHKYFVLCYFLGNLAIGTASAQTPETPDQNGATAVDPIFKPSGSVEAGGDYQGVSNGFGDWFGQYAKGEIQTDKNNNWNGELLHQREFGTTGTYAALGNTHTFNQDWYSTVDIGGGAGGEFLPRQRVDVFINRKWLDQRQLVTTIGLGEDHAMDSHSDRSIFFGGTYYFAAPWIVQGGIRFNESDPGSIEATSQFVAVTQGRDKEHFLTLRYGFGKEAYQIIDNDQTLSNFNSQQVSLQLKEWVGKDWGFDTTAEAYHNPNYDRNGITFGIFKEF